MSKRQRKSGQSSRLPSSMTGARGRPTTKTRPHGPAGPIRHRIHQGQAGPPMPERTYVTVVDMPSFKDDAYGMATLQQLDELRRNVVRERGHVYYEQGC